MATRPRFESQHSDGSIRLDVLRDEGAARNQLTALSFGANLASRMLTPLEPTPKIARLAPYRDARRCPAASTPS
jgi:hypothetical protein